MRSVFGRKFMAMCFAAAVFAVSAQAQDKPKVAVYVTDGGDKSLAAKILAGAGAHGVVGEALVKAINVTGKANAVNLTKDITKDFGYSVGEAQAADVGKQFGVQNLCVVTISGIKGKSFNLGVKMIDVSNGRVTATGGPVPIDFGNAAGIPAAMGNIALGLVKGLAMTALTNAVSGNTGGGAASPPPPPAPVASPVQPGQAAPAAAPAPAQPAQTAVQVQYASPAQPAEPTAPSRKPAAVPPPPPPPSATPALRASPQLPLNERPWIAVYVRGRAKDDEIKAAFGPELLFALAKSGRYRAIESNVEFAAHVNREAEKFGVNSLTDRQIALIAGGANADFVCIVEVATVLGSYQVFARVINVKTIDAAEMGKAIGKIAYAEDVPAVADKVVESMFGVSGASMPQIQEMQQQILEMREWVRSVEKQTQVQHIELQVQSVQQQVQKVDQKVDHVQRQVHTAHPKFVPRVEEEGPDNKPRYLKKGVSIEWGVGIPFNNNDYSGYYDPSYGYPYTGSNPDFDPVGIGTHFNLNLIYAEIFSGAWTVGYAEAGLLLKIPIGNDYFKWYPLLGVSINSDKGGGFVTGSRVEIGMGEVTYATSEYLYSLAGYEGSYTLKSGVGWDIGFGEGKKGFFRPEARYLWIVTPDSDVSKTRYLWEIKAGLGYKWAGKKRISVSGPDY